MAHLKIDVLKFGITIGIISSLLVLIISLLGEAGFAQTWIDLLIEIYGGIGYNTTIIGAILGIIYTFIDTFIISILLALLYNRLL